MDAAGFGPASLSPAISEMYAFLQKRRRPQTQHPPAMITLPGNPATRTIESHNRTWLSRLFNSPRLRILRTSRIGPDYAGPDLDSIDSIKGLSIELIDAARVFASKEEFPTSSLVDRPGVLTRPPLLVIKISESALPERVAD